MAGLEIASPATGWLQLALQLSHDMKSVFYGVAAVGAVHWQHRAIIHVTLESVLHPADIEIAEIQHSKATTALRRHVDQALDGRASTEAVLLGSLLFAVYEVFRRRSDLAMAHFSQGKRIARQLLSSPSDDNQVREGTIQSGLKSVFDPFFFMEDGRMPEEFLPGFHMQHGEDHYESLSVLPSTFASVQEAKSFLELLMATSRAFRTDIALLAARYARPQLESHPHEGVQVCIKHSLGRVVPLALDARLSGRQERLQNIYVAWLAALEISGLDVSTWTARSLLVMRIQYHVSHLHLAICRDTEECLTDNYQDQFVVMLDLVEAYLDQDTVNTCAKHSIEIGEAEIDQGEAQFSIEYIIIPALYATCVKCRCGRTRRRALSMLRRTNRTEGLYWTGLMSVISEGIILFEEEEAANMTVGDDPRTPSHGLESNQIPEAARFSDCIVYCDPHQPGNVSFIYSRWRIGGGQDPSGDSLEIWSREGRGHPVKFAPVQQLAALSRAIFA